MIGKTISHYKITEKLGEGGMGVVYKAEDTKLDRFVALKFLPQHLSTGEDEKKRFIHEAKAASALNHNNIGMIHEIDDTEDGQLFIVMAYYEGETLKDRIESHKAGLPTDEAIDIAKQIAEGLAKAHSKDIIHRDIKPANILITEDGEVKIIDFGLAKLAGRTQLTKSGMTIGTTAYMSPEQAQGVAVDHRTDIWSLGVVFYEMLTGDQPFKGDYEQAVIYSILHEDPEPLTSVRLDLSPEGKLIIKRALSKNQDERYQNLVELLTDLENLSEVRPRSLKLQLQQDLDHGTSKKQFKRIPFTVGILFVLALTFFLLRPYFSDEILISSPKPIAVIGFENMTGDSTYDYLQKVIPNLFITSLEQSPYLRVATWERLRDLSKQAGRKDVDVIDKDLGFELCRLAGINTVVVGSFTRAGDVFVTNVKVLDVESKGILTSASAKGAGVGSILATQIDEISKEISRELGIAQRKIAETQRPIAEVTTTSLEAYNNFILGRDATSKFYRNDAIRYLSKAVALDSTFAIAHFYLSRYRPRHRELAKRFAHKATRKFQLYIEARLADSREKRLSMMEEYVRKYPKEKRGHVTLAGLYSGRGSYKEALEESQKALELDPEWGPALNYLGYAYAHMGQFEKSIQAMKRYISVDPGNANAFDSLADVYLRMGKLDEAIENFKQALALKPDFTEDWILAYCYALKEDYEQALAWNMSLIRKQPPGISLFGLAALYHYFSGSRKQAFRDLAREAQVADSMGAEHSRIEVEGIKGWIYYDQGNLESARTANRIYADWHIEKRQPNSRYKVYNNACLGLVSVKNSKLDSAAYYLDNVASLLLESSQERSAEYKNLYYHLLYAELLLSQDSLAKAITVAKRISVPKIPQLVSLNLINYNFPFVLDVLARAYKKRGDLDKAIAEYERLTKIDPLSNDRRLINSIYHYRLAKLYQESGLSFKAISRYEKFLHIWKNADEDLPELIEAKARLARLKKMLIK